MADYQAPYNLDSMLNELPISLQYSEDSNNAKMLKVFADEMVNIQNLLNKIETWRDVDNAQGKALDMIGEDHGVYRNGVDDDFYRFEIKVKRIQRTTDGTYDSLIKLVANSLNADYSDINVRPMYEDESKEPNAVKITNIPATYIDDPRKKQLVLNQLQQSVIAGVRVALVQYVSQTAMTAYISAFTQQQKHHYPRLNESNLKGVI